MSWPRPDFTDLTAVFLNCTVQPSGRPWVCDCWGGVYPDMTERGGPGPSYLDVGSGGPQDDVTQRDATFVTWTLMRLAAVLERAGGFPVGGDSRAAWDAGERFDHPNLEYR